MKEVRRVAIVTGAGRGIGRAIALRLARAGNDIVAVDLSLNSESDLSGRDNGSVVEEIEAGGGRATGHVGDLCDPTTAKTMVECAVEKFGQVDILVNNCGGALSPIERSLPSVVPEEDLESMLRLNLFSTVACCQAVAPEMIRRGGGSIVNISSRAGLLPAWRDARLTGYGLAKSCVIQYTRFLAFELGPQNVRVNCVAPGTIGTERILRSAQQRGMATEADVANIPLRRFGRPEEVAGTVHFLTSDDAAYITGQCLPVCGGTVLTPS